MNVSVKEVNPSDHQEDYSIKVVIIGDSGVGKSNIVSQYVDNKFLSNSKATVGVELFFKMYEIEGKIVKVNFWDTAGTERFNSLTRGYYKGAKAACVLYDITRKQTFENVSNWQNELSNYAEQGIKIILVGNKTDLEDQRQVDSAEATKFAETNDYLFMETSAKTAHNVKDAFETLINCIPLNSNVRPNYRNDQGRRRNRQH